MADRGNGVQRLAAEAQRAHGAQVIGAGDFARGVALEGKIDLGGGNAAAVVAHAHQAQAALARLDANLRRAGVDGIVQQLFDHRRRTFDDFAGGDLSGYLRVQNLDWHDVPVLPVRARRGAG